MQSKKKIKCFNELIIDEVYTFINNRKNNKYYIFTALGIDKNNNKYPFYHLCNHKNFNDLLNFDSQIPHSNVVYSDCNPLYAGYYGSINIAKKGVKTNLIESLNSQIRQFNSSLKRKTKCYAKDFDMLNKTLAQTFITKIIK